MTKYIKLMRKDEIHNGYKFKTGLNKLINEQWNPNLDEGGGFYFCDLDTFPYWMMLYDDICWFRYVTIPKGVEVVKGRIKYKAPEIILGERRSLAQLKITEKHIKISNKLINYIDKRDIRSILDKVPDAVFSYEHADKALFKYAYYNMKFDYEWTIITLKQVVFAMFVIFCFILRYYTNSE